MNKEKSSPIKLTWEKGETFDDIRKKLLSVVGKDVVSTKDTAKHFTIFTVGDIYEDYLEFLGDGFFKFLEGDVGYSTKNGDYNFKGSRRFDIWAFIVEYGRVDEVSGNRYSKPYKFYIPRTPKSTYAEDLKRCPLVFDLSSKFMFYNI